MMERTRLALLALTAVAAGLLSGCGSDSQATSTAAQATTTKRSTVTEIPQVPLKPCRVRSGGSDVMAANVTCHEVGGTISHWAPRSVFGQGDKRTGVFLEDGWQCWAELQARYGPILNVCMRDDAVFTYLFH